MYGIRKGAVFNGYLTSMYLNQNDKKTVGRRLLKFFLPMIMVTLFLSGCASGGEKKPKSMPAPDPNVSPIPSPLPTITAAPASEKTETDTEDAETSVDDQEASDSKEADKTYVVVLDPGHGGNWFGAMYDGKNEKDLTLSVANYVRDYLYDNYTGIEVYLTRETDIALDGDLKIELEKRAIVAEEKNADYFVSIHFNASEEHLLHGATVYASMRDDVTERSKGIAASILKELVALGLKDNDVKTRISQDYFAEDGSRLDYYAVIRHSAIRHIPGVIVEHCFMDNEIDKEFMNTDEKLHALAEADARGIANYLGLPAKSE